MRTIGKDLTDNKGNGPGFYILRLSLALSILFIHCFPIATGQTEVLGLQNIADAPPTAVATDTGFHLIAWVRETFLHKHNADAHFANIFVPMFFALSGFLVSGSALRLNSLTKFLTFRALRIVPALFVEVSLSALVLGPLVTAYTLERYFSDPKFLDYFGNIAGRVRFLLPGVFLTNPSKEIVNANLWTLPAEFYCYLIIAALLITGVLFTRKALTAICAIALLLWIIFDVNYRYLYASDIQRGTIMAVAFFFCGSLLFQYREFVPLQFPIFLVCGLVTYLNVIATPGIHSWMQYPSIACLSYVTIYIGFLRLPELEADYSYGIYLYGYPICQTLVFALPFAKGHPLLLFAVGASATIAFAAFSWHFFEKPALKLKRIILKPSPVAQTI